jgi:hypothetical protein
MKFTALFILHNTSQSLTYCIQESGFSNSRVSDQSNLESEMVIVVFLVIGVSTSCTHVGHVAIVVSSTWGALVASSWKKLLLSSVVRLHFL